MDPMVSSEVDPRDATLVPMLEAERPPRKVTFATGSESDGGESLWYMERDRLRSEVGLALFIAILIVAPIEITLWARRAHLMPNTTQSSLLEGSGSLGTNPSVMQFQGDPSTRHKGLPSGGAEATATMKSRDNVPARSLSGPPLLSETQNAFSHLTQLSDPPPSGVLSKGVHETASSNEPVGVAHSQTTWPAEATIRYPSNVHQAEPDSARVVDGVNSVTERNGHHVPALNDIGANSATPQRAGSPISNMAPTGNEEQAVTSRIVVPPPETEETVRDVAATEVRESIIDQIQVWRLEEPSVPEQKRLCRISRACRTEDGAILLPHWLRERHTDVVNCGLKNVRYILNEQMPDGLIADLTGQFRLSTGLMRHDLIGTDSPRDHMPHFVTDMMPLLVAADTLLGTSPTIRSSTACRSPTNSCDPNMKLDLLLPVQKAILDKPDDYWTRKFLRILLRAPMNIKKLDIEGSYAVARPRFAGQPGALCFRSLISTNFAPGDFKNANIFKDTHPVFSSNGIARSVATRKSGSQAHCLLQVTLQQRTGSREILNIPDITRAIVDAATRVGFEARVSVVDFDHLDFESQVSAMQTADIMVASHGAGNTNFFFLRPNTPVLEVFPFGYRAGPFDSIAMAMGVQYDQVVAAPDAGIFIPCMQASREDPEYVMEVINAYNMAASNQMPNGLGGSLRLESGDHRQSARRCARMQNLRFDPNIAAVFVAEKGRQLCGLR